MKEVIDLINSIVWSDALIALCLAAGIYFSIILKFPQIRLLPEMIRLLTQGKESKEGTSSFQAFALAISGRVGTGNIAGVATAIALGGPGAIFWMWVIAFLGSSSAYIEATLGQMYKEVKGGEFRGGPAYYITKGLGVKWYGYAFAIITIISMSIFLPGIQSNSIAAGVNQAFDLDFHYTGLIVTALLAFVIMGGMRRIAFVAQVVVPVMAALYILCAVVIISMNISEVPVVLSLIVKSAFGAEEMFSGIVGMAIAWGVKRGIYSNEAGQGSAPHAAASAEVDHPAQQGLVQAFSVYVDTLFVCTATALMILFTGSYNVQQPDSEGFIVENLEGVSFGPEFTQFAIDSQFPGMGQEFVAIALFFFAFTTLMAYYFMAESNVQFIDKNGDKKWMVYILRVITLIVAYFGAVQTTELSWALGDIGVGAMAWLNIIAIFLLRKPAIRALKDYENQRKSGKKITFDPKSIDAKNCDYWENRD